MSRPPRAPPARPLGRCSVELVDVLAAARPEETEGFTAEPRLLKHRQLLWHGSGMGNWGALHPPAAHRCRLASPPLPAGGGWRLAAWARGGGVAWEGGGARASASSTPRCAEPRPGAGAGAGGAGSILKTGLRIAPPEAPVTGWLFGKGMYFANVIGKSAAYCQMTGDGDYGVLALLEVALVSQSQQRLHCCPHGPLCARAPRLHPLRAAGGVGGA